MEITVTSLLTSVWLLSSIYFYRQPQLTRAALAKPRAGCCLIVYASQTGQARQLAEQLAEQMQQSNLTQGDRRRAPDDVQLASIAQLSAEKLHHYQEVLFIVSTAGHGEPPDHARPFSAALRRLKQGSLRASRVRFAVLALGDSSYEHFCGYGRWLEAELIRCGLSPLWPRIDVDRCAGKDIQSWQHQLAQYFAITSTSRPAQQFHRYRLLAREQLNPGSPSAALFWLSLTPSDPTQQLPIQAGDVIDVYLPNHETRSYSLANAPRLSVEQKANIELIVRQHTRADGRPGIGDRASRCSQ